MVKAEERLYSLREFSRILENNPNSPMQRSHECLRLWAVEGRVIDGKRKKLRCKMIGSARFTKMSWFLEFLDEK